MSRKKGKNRNSAQKHQPSKNGHGAPHSLSGTVASTTLPTPAPGSSVPKQPSLWSKLSANVPWLALVISISSAFGTVYNSLNARRAYDRAAGNLRAELECVTYLPGPFDVPGDLVVYSDITRRNELTLKNVKDFLRVDPKVVLKNAGSDPIDSVRIETRHLFSFIDMVDQSPERQFTSVPWILDQVSRHDYELGAKLMPGKSVEVNITRGLLAQMIQLQARDKEDRPHYARFEVRCMAKLVGATAYDDAIDQKGFSVNVVWYPSGFQDEDCKQLLNDLKPAPYIEP